MGQVGTRGSGLMGQTQDGPSILMGVTSGSNTSQNSFPEKPVVQHVVQVSQSSTGSKIANIVFNDQNPNEAFVKFNLKVNAGADFKITLSHQMPQTFSVVIISADNKIVFEGKEDNENEFSLGLSNAKFKKGEYWVLVYPNWSRETNDADKKVSVDVAGNSVGKIETTQHSEGM